MSREFDLDEAINGAKIQARNGYPARILCTDRKGRFPLVALLGADTVDIVMTYTECGRCNIDAESSYDLVMAPTKKYINIFQDKDGMYHCSKRSYPTVAMAKELEGFVPRKYKGSRYVATIEVEA